MPIDGFIVDFVCYSARLVVEVDGGQHNMQPGILADAARDKYLRSQDFHVLRFWNNDVLGNSDGVAEVIAGAIGLSTPTPDPSPQGGGESDAALS